MTIRRTNHFRLSAPAGFTLVEIVITIVLISIIAAIAAMIIMQGVAGYAEGDRNSSIHYQARLAMERMVREIRLIRSQNDIATWTSTDLRYIDMNGATTGFNWANPILNRRNGAVNDMLATGITALAFNYFRQDGTTAAATTAEVWFVEITLTSQQDATSLVMRSRVHPMNF